MSCNTIRNKDGGVTIEIDRPELYLREVRDRDGKIIEEECFIKEPELSEGPCEYRGAVTKTVPCCGGKTRPIEIMCKRINSPIGIGTCNKPGCKYYKELDFALLAICV